MPEAETQLETIRGALQLYYTALSGKRTPLASNVETVIYLPEHDQRKTIRLPTRESRSWYRVALAHRAMHEESGSRRARLNLGGRGEPRLALDCFVLLEDLRVDERIARRYAGLAPELRALQARELEARPPLHGLSPRSALLELLARISLGWRGAIPLAHHAADLTRIAVALAEPAATVEHSFEAARRIYQLLIETLPERVPNVAPVSYRDPPDDFMDLILNRGDSDEDFAVDYETQIAAPVGGKRVEVGGRSQRSDDPEPDISSEDEGMQPGALQPEPGAFLYPEWDYKAGMYRQRWCLVRESVASATKSAEVYRATVAERRKLVAQIRGYFERIAPDTLRRVRGMPEGEDLNMDAAIDALIDVPAGVPPRAEVYERRERVQRDVAVIFLVDLSWSTNQTFFAGNRQRRILNLELDSLILLMAPLARLGDAFGMYGFSGTSRADVRLVRIKDIKESPTEHVISRFDSLTPIGTTRMGAAIRHAATKFRGQLAGTRLLMIISDGRPFDLEYGQQYGAEIDYAIHDTRAALDDVRAQGIRPFLLTIDSDAVDYLAPMCRDLDYEIISDVADLPKRLATLYRRLTTP
jgi:nitric oxide reductase NorD protein